MSLDMNTATITTGTRVQHTTNGKIGTVTFVGDKSAAGSFNIRVAWDGARASVVFGQSVRVVSE